MPERPRVLQLGPDPAIGGGMAASLRALLASPLAERYELQVVPTYRGAEPLARLGLFASALLRLLVWSASGRGRLVHVHGTVRGSAYRKAVVVVLARLLRRRVVFQIHSGPGDVEAFTGGLAPSRRRALRWCFGRADVVLAVSRASARAIEAGYGLRDVRVVPNPAPPVVALERRRAAVGEPLTAVYLGGFANRAKGADTLVAAIAVARRRDPSLHFVLAGPGEPPPEAASLFAGDGVEWRGWLDPAAKDRLLRDSEVFVISSRSEGLPMALLEAMSYGLAIVSTAVGGVPETLDGGEAGLLVEPENPGELATALARLAADPDLRERLSAAARDAAERLDSSVVAARLDEIYSELLSR